MKQIKQFRFYGDGNENNFPVDLTSSTLISGNILNQYNSITQLGIQGQSNTSFYLNDSIFPITLGETGIYELDLQDRGTIYSINFINNSTFQNYGENNRLLIDIIYDE